MKPYDDNVLSERELMFALPSIIIGISVFALPSEIAMVTSHSDGWISILIAGVIFTLLAYMSAKLAASFPGKSFYTYSAMLVSKPVAIFFTFMIGVVAVFLEAYIVRSLANISQQYLFNKTPMEVIALCFLLVVVYAVAGTRAGIFRLNILFLPIILTVYFFVVLFNAQKIDFENFFPLFTTDLAGYGKGIIHSLSAFAGFGILLFYMAFVKQPKNLAKIALVGIGLPTVFYMIIFLTSIGIFGHTVASNLNFPTVEIAKRATIPGGLLERIDAAVFTIWIMSIFNSAAIIYDVAVLQFTALFKVKKMHLILVIAPVAFYIAMFPQTRHQINLLANVVGYISVGLITLVILLLFVISKWRRPKSDAKS